MNLFTKTGVVILLLLTLCVINIKAQTTFNNRIDYNNRLDGSACLLIENGTILIGVNSGYFPTNTFRISILKMDINGNVLSKKSFVRDSLSFCVGNNIIKYNNEYFMPGPCGDYHGHIYGCIYEFNSNLDTIRTIIKGDTSFYTYYTSLIKKGNDLYIFGSSDSTCSVSGYKFFLKKADSLGNILWQKEYSSTCPHRNDRNMDTTHSNGFVMCGFEQTNPSGWGTTRIIKTDSQGNQIWAKNYGNINTDLPTIVTTKTTGYLIATNQIDSSYLNTWYWETLKLYRINENGDTVWTKKIGNKTEDFSPLNIKQLSDYDFIICGVKRIAHYDISGNMVSNQLQGFLCRTDSSGNVKWFHNYTGNYPNDSGAVNYLYDVAQTSDGSFVAVGDVGPTDGGTQDVWVIKVDSMGCLVPGCNGTLGVTTIHIGEPEFNIYPNPAKNFIDIKIEGINDFKNYYVTITDIWGRTVSKEKITQNQTELNSNNLPNGIYLLKINDGSSIRLNKKVIVQH